MEEVPKVIIYNKPVGEVLSESLKEIKDKYKISADVKVAYAGRLDPLASGLVLFLIGDECKNRDFYQRLPKTYRFEILLGFKTDTLDLMGMLLNYQYVDISKKNSIELILSKKIKSFVGQFLQKYPDYSSARFRGKPLFWWARNNRMDEIKKPIKEVELFDIRLLNSRIISKAEIYEIQESYLKRVKGDFRQNDIRDSWMASNDKVTGESIVISFRVEVSSGLYIRTLSTNLSELIGLDSLAINIFREQIGKFILEK